MRPDEERCAGSPGGASGPSPTSGGVVAYDPWAHLRALPQVSLRWSRDDRELADALAWWYPDAGEIVMDDRQPQAARRCTLAHELVHAERGDEPCASTVLENRQERAVDREAARRLIDLRALADALSWTHDVAEAADELWVDVATLLRRLADLDDGERAYVRRRLAGSA